MLLIRPKVNIVAQDGVLYEGVAVECDDARVQSWIDRGWAERAECAEVTKPADARPPLPELEPAETESIAVTRAVGADLPPPVTKRRRP